MGEEKLTQFGIAIDCKNRLDRFKSDNKEKIIERYKKKKQLVTNTDAINYLMDVSKVRK